MSIILKLLFYFATCCHVATAFSTDRNDLIVPSTEPSKESSNNETNSKVKSNAYISGFLMEIDGKGYKPYVKEKEEAKQIYNEANARDSNRFTVHIRKCRTSEKSNLHINLGRITSTSKRTIRDCHDVVLASIAAVNIANSTSAVVKFNPNIERQKQLGTKEENGLAGQFVVQYDVERDPQGGKILLQDDYFVHFFAPSDISPSPKEVTFPLDTSGSMRGIRIKQLKEAMNSFLAELKTKDLFSIVELFNIIVVKVWNADKVEIDYEIREYLLRHSKSKISKTYKTNQVLPPPYEASEENINKAKQVVSKLNADGGTDIKSARISEINIGAMRSPIFSLSFGNGADRNFLQKISLNNLGFSRHINEAGDVSLQLQEFYKQISSLLLNNISFKYVSNVTKLTKTEFPIFFPGSELVIFGVLEDNRFAPPEIRGNSFKGPIAWVRKLETPVGDLERLWAYLTIKQILEARDAAENKTQLTKQALEVALKYSFVL